MCICISILFSLFCCSVFFFTVFVFFSTAFTNSLPGLICHKATQKHKSQGLFHKIFSQKKFYRSNVGTLLCANKQFTCNQTQQQELQQLVYICLSAFRKHDFFFYFHGKFFSYFLAKNKQTKTTTMIKY